MCDYSLMQFPNRLAVEGEELVAYRFPSGSMGLASPADFRRNTECQPSRHSFWASLKKFFSPAEPCSVPAVCIPPSARLLIHDIDQNFQREYGLHGEEEGTFEQVSAAVNAYRDAIRFRNGRLVRLQELPEGQRIMVLDMSPREAHVPETAVEAGLGPDRFLLRSS